MYSVPDCWANGLLLCTDLALHEVGTSLQMRILRLKGVKQFVQDSTTAQWWNIASSFNFNKTRIHSYLHYPPVLKQNQSSKSLNDPLKVTQVINDENQNWNPSLLLFSWYISPRSRPWDKGLSASHLYRKWSQEAPAGEQGMETEKGRQTIKGVLSSKLPQQATTRCQFNPTRCRCRHTSVLSHMRWGIYPTIPTQ